MKWRFLVILFSFLSRADSFCQNSVLIPEIINFSKKSYEAGNQNRAIGQDKNGLLYFANVDGLLVFDGTYWKTYPLPNRSMIRSLFVEGDRVYIGGQQEIGYFFFDRRGELTYQSLKPLIPAGEEEFTDVWNVLSYENDIFFRSNKRVFRFHKNKISAFRSADWKFLGVSRGLLIAQQYENGLMVFTGGQWLPFNTKYDFSKNKMTVKSVTEFGSHQIFMATLKSGIFIIDDNEISKFENASIAEIIPKIIHFSCAIDTGRIVIATKLGGYYILDSRGEIAQHITKREGLQTNTINSVYVDKEKNIWLGLDNGIDLIVNNSAINYINPDYDNKSPGYTAIIYHDQLYIGTNNGLYNVPVSPGNMLGETQGSFKLVKNSNGIVWGLSVVNNQLLMGRNDGAFVVNNKESLPVDTSNGFWSFQAPGNRQPSPYMIAGTYNGINLYHFEAGKFSNPRINTIFESAKYTVIAGEDIWAAHPYQGLYKISLNDSGKLVHTTYRDVNNILSSGHNHLFKIFNKILLLTRKGIFEYDKSIKDFKPSAFFNKLFHAAYISYLREDAQGNIWFIQDKRPGVIDMSFPEKPVITYFPELNNKVLGNDDEFIYPINKNNILIAGEIGFYHIDFEKYKSTNRGLRVLLRTASSFYRKDSVLFGGYRIGNDSLDQDEIFDLKNNLGYRWNSIHFEFSSPYFGGTVEYSCRLKGYEKELSAWSKRTERSYTNLPPGEYIFELRARNGIGDQSSLTQFRFTVSSPWYRSLLAYLIYLVLITAIIYFFYKKQQKKYLVQLANRQKEQQKKFTEEQERLQYLHQLEMEKNEKEIIGLKNIKLEAEVKHNNAELASNTMSLLQKKELLNKIKEEIIKVQDEPESERKAKNIRRIIKIINDQLDVNDDWERFSLYFDKVNNDFLKILKDSFPFLTPTDFKLCAYLRLNLSTKEIAGLLNLSIRGVESSRYRLRKKLDLSNDISLFDYLGSIGSRQVNNGSHPIREPQTESTRSFEL